MPNSESSTADLDVNLRSSWADGIVVDFSLVAEQPLNGWTIEFEYAGDIVNIWNARIVLRDGNRYVVESMGYNSVLAAGVSTAFGFQGSGSSTDIIPISINGDAFDVDDDPVPTPLPTVSVDNAVASEEDGSITFTLSLSALSDEDVIIDVETVSGSAEAGSDFMPMQAQVVIPAGQMSASVTLQLANDDTPEDTEQFELRLVSVQGAEITDGVGLGQITDSDMDPTPPEPPADPVDPPSDDDGGGTYEISLDDWGSGFVARFYITPGEAISGGWTATIATSATITNIWNAEIVSHESGILTIRNASWNASIGADETIEVGVQGNGSAAGLDLVSTNLPLAGVTEPDPDPVDPPVDPDPVDPDPVDPGTGGGSGPFVGGGQTYVVGQTQVVMGFDPTRDMLDLGPNSIHNQIPMDTADGFMMLHMFNPSLSMLVEGVYLADLHPESFAPILDSHLQQDLSAALAYEDGSGLVRPNTVYVRSHEEGLEEIVDFNPATDKISFFYLSVRGDSQRNFAVEDTPQGARFYNPLNGQSLTLRDVSFADLDSSHFEWRANQLEDGIAGRMGLDAVIDGFTYPSENIFSGKSVAMAGGIDRAPYHSQPEYTGTPIGSSTDPVDPDPVAPPMDPPVDPGPVDPPVDPEPVDPDPMDPGTGGGSGPFVGGGQAYVVGQTQVVTGFDPTRDILDLGPNSIHNQIPVDTADGFMMLHMFNPSLSMLVEGVYLADLHPESFAPILDSHLQQDMSAALAYEDGSGLVRPNTVYVRSHEEGLEEIVDFNPATDTVSFFYLSVRGDGERNFAVEDTAQGARFYNPLNGQSLTLRDVSFSDLDSSHFEWRANQLEDGIAGRMGLAGVIDGFTYPNENIFSGKSLAMAGGVDRAPYHSQPEYTGIPIGNGTDPVDPVDPGDSGSGSAPVMVTVTGGSVTESDPGMVHVHDDGTGHVHDDGHRYITFTVALDAPAVDEITLTYATADGTAIANTTSDVTWDYHETTGTLIFTAGEQTKTVVVSVHPDILVEDTETFTLSVTGENIAGILQATGTILDNDIADPVDPDPVDPAPVPDPHPHPHPMPSDFNDITEYGVHHGTSSHTGHDDLMGGRTPITTEAVIAYNALRNFLGLEDVTIEDVGTWAFDNTLTNNTQAWGGDLQGVGLWYAMQGAKVGWIDDDAFDPQILADIQREARLGDPANVLAMVEQYGHDGFADFLIQHGLDGHFIETLKMEPHYGGWMHGRTHGWLNLPEGAIAHDVNHLTVLSHDQTQPFMNDTFDWPQWPALNVPHQDVIDYFQSMVVLGDPLGDALPSNDVGPDPVVPDPVLPDPVDPDPSPATGDGSDSLDARLAIENDWGSGAVINLEITNVDRFQFTSGWTVTFDFDPLWITGSWNSDWSAENGRLTVSDVGWNGSISAGQTVVVGFQVNTGNQDEDLMNTEAEFLFL